MDARMLDAELASVRRQLTETKLPVDTVYDVVAPENVVFQYRIAGPFARIWAYTLDLAAMNLYLFVSSIGANYFFCSLLPDMSLVSSDLGSNLFYAFFWLNLMFIFWFWNAFFEAFFNGRTIGKAAMGLRTLTVAGRPIGRSQALLRNILRYADLMLGPICVLIMGMNDRMARIGDLAAGTMVVIDRKKKETLSSFIEQPLICNIESQISTDFEISSSLHKTLALYVSRRDEISDARSDEIIKPLVNVLVRETNFPYSVNPDAFLWALYRRSLKLQRHF